MLLNQVPLFLQPLKEVLQQQMLKAFFAVTWFVRRVLTSAGKDKTESPKTKVVKSILVIVSSLAMSRDMNAGYSDNPVLQLASALQ